MLIPDLNHRRREQEWMDEPDVDLATLRKSLRFIRRVNTFLGYRKATIKHLERFSGSWKPGEQVTILDVATGSADIPMGILRWGERRGFDLRIVGLDLHAGTLGIAREATTAARQRLHFVRGDASHLPFAAGSVDYVITAMFLHHLDDSVAIGALAEMKRVAKRGVIAADLLRSRRAYAWIRLFTALSEPIINHDARVSVAQAFSLPEARALADAAGLHQAQVHRHSGHRFVIAGEWGCG